MKLPPGDLTQIRELRQMYNVALEAKEKILKLALKDTWTADELVELNVGLQLITARLKKLDGKIHYLTFGEETEAEATPLTLQELLKDERDVRTARKSKETLLGWIDRLRNLNGILADKNSKLKKKLEKKYDFLNLK